jgi:hypothetical protein
LLKETGLKGFLGALADSCIFPSSAALASALLLSVSEALAWSAKSPDSCSIWVASPCESGVDARRSSPFIGKVCCPTSATHIRIPLIGT